MKREVRRRVKQLIAREIRGAAFRQPPDHIQFESAEVQEAWSDVCLQLADQIDREGK